MGFSCYHDWVSAPSHSTRYSYSSIAGERKTARWMSSGLLLHDVDFNLLSRYIRCICWGKVGCPREVKEPWVKLGIPPYDTRRGPLSSIWGATDQLKLNLTQKFGQLDVPNIPSDDSREAALYPKVVFYRDDDICEYVSAPNWCSQNPWQLRLTLDVILAHQTINFCLPMMNYLGCTG